DPEKYILEHCDHFAMDDVLLRGDLMTFDKPEVVKDLLQGADIRYDRLDITAYDRVIDATGISRAWLPPIKKDILLPCVQRRVQTDETLENRIKFGGIGYAWCFPLADHGYHIGYGSLAGDPNCALRKLGWLPDKPNWNVLCSCKGKIRLTGPHDSLPFVADGVWGVGEAIGCVAPLAGDGVVSGMKSVKIILEHWDDPEGYTKTILKEFEWMKKERAVIDKLLAGDHLRIKDAWVLKKNARRMAMQIDIKDAFVLLKSLR
ncbi:MAG: hypothetical protein PVG99_15215, partial [Desulfobacteraceae bacterium]